MSRQNWLIAILVAVNVAFFVLLDRRDVAAQGNATGAVGRYQIAVAPPARNEFHAMVYMVDTATGQVWLCEDSKHKLDEGGWKKYNLLPAGR